MQTSVNSTAVVPAVADKEPIDIHVLFVTLSQGRWIILAVMLLGLCAGALLAFIAPHVYQVDSLIQVESQKNGNNVAIGELAEAFDKNAPVNGEMEIIGSRMVLGQVVDQLNLTVHAEPRYFSKIGQAFARRFVTNSQYPLAEPFLGLRRYAWGGERIVVTRLEFPNSLASQRLTLRAINRGEYELITPSGKILGRGRVGSIFSSGDGQERLQLFVQELICRPDSEFLIYSTQRSEEIKEISSQLRVAEKIKGSGMLRMTMTGTNPALIRRILQEIAITYQRQNIERKSAEAQATLSFLESRLPDIKKSVVASEEALNEFRLRAGSVDLTKETDLFLQESVATERGRLELEQKRREALQRFTASHPSVQTLDAQISRLREKFSRVSVQIKDLPEIQQELLRLMRDVKVNTDLYTNLLNSSQQLQVVRAGTVGNVRIIDAPEQPLHPIKPRVSIIIASALFVGFLVGIGVVCLRRALLTGVDDSAEVEAALGIPTYANVPFARKQSSLLQGIKDGTSQHSLLATAYPHEVTVEAIRSLRTALHFALLDAPNNVVMLTGPSPGLGKSFISLNLSAVLASGGKKVLIIDADMRRGHMHETFRLGRGPGLSDLIAGSVTLDVALRPTGVENLFIITSGVIPPNPAELLLKDQFSQLLKQLSQQFDHVIIDTPPILAVTDAAIVGRRAGTTLLVLKAGDHPIRMIVDAHRRLLAAGLMVRGTLMNHVSDRSNSYGAYEYRNGNYQYQYGSKS